MLPIIYMLWWIECFDFNVLLFKDLFLFLFIDCFKLLVSQKNNVCVCVCVCVQAGGCVHACVRACVCVFSGRYLSVIRRKRAQQCD